MKVKLLFFLTLSLLYFAVYIFDALAFSPESQADLALAQFSKSDDAAAKLRFVTTARELLWFWGYVVFVVLYWWGDFWCFLTSLFSKKD
jgi:hypothetical protein